MKGEIIKTASVSEMHRNMDLEPPKHPLITVIDTELISFSEEEIGSKLICDLYMVAIKDKSCGMEYGRNALDFSEGVMVFSAPGQVYTPSRAIELGEVKGWLLYFHPDLLHDTHLGNMIDQYSFFNYDVYEALHLSADEERIINDCVNNITHEYSQRIDAHSKRVIVSNLELLLTYSQRFYERQFHTRSHQSKGVVTQFERELKAYYRDSNALETGLPTIQHFAEKANLSQHYFSDLIKKETGRSPKDHINDFIVEKAKNMLLASENTVSEIAYDLGFNYPHYFTRLFKSRTGHTPVAYRSLN